MIVIFSVLLCAVQTILTPNLCSADPTLKHAILTAHPQNFEITGKRDPLQLIVTASQNEQTFDVTRDCKYEVDTDTITVSATGLVSPEVNGKSTITIRWEDQTTQVTVTVANAEQPQLISFDYDVLPILAQTGCSGGSCHGAPHGKAGFQLS
ncbi:hypothetical protein N9F76_00745, partial [bacterium]|nr:hypothetical protein [bacterium]